MKVKICGIKNIDDALLCEKLGAEALGFIFFSESKRYIEPEAVRKIIEKLSPFTVKVGVFVNESAKNINEIASTVRLNAVQLHGDEKPDILKEIDFPVIKSFRIDESFDYSTLSKYKDVSYLLDSYSVNEYGGTGKKFDWEKIPISLRHKIILSGGVSSENIEYIFTQIKPKTVDLSSSVEIVPGKKDKNKLNEFFNKINYLKHKL